MKASKPYTAWIMFMSILYTLNTCGRAVILGRFGKVTRSWVDETLSLWVTRVLKLVRVSYTVVNPHGVKPQPGVPTIVMCNHSSLYDIPLSLAAFPCNSLRMLAKKEMAKLPVMGRAMVVAEFPFIDRKNRHQAMKDLAFVHKLLNSGIVMWIAPEGTRSKDGLLGPFKKGAFITAIQANAMIIPIGIRGANQILPARTYQFNLNQVAEVHVGEPIDASQYTVDNKDELLERVHHVMKGLVGEA
jgi:1-acyl-sn-glycerol-3-phosphate acyltransferase